MSVLQREVLDALSVPDWEDLTGPQTRGAACVWCAAPLAGGPVVDLGARRVQLSGGLITVFPRACTICMRAARQAHARVCEQCTDGVARCESGRMLSGDTSH